jgi:surface protein
MFDGASAFNQPLDLWDVSNVTDMKFMFMDAKAFNQNLTWWCVANIKTSPSGFDVRSALVSEHLPMWGTCPPR